MQIGWLYIGFLITAFIFTVVKRIRQLIKRIDKLENYIAIHGKETEEEKGTDQKKRS